MATDRNRVALPARKLVKSAAVALALLFAMLRPVCEALAASGEWHAPGQTERGAVHMTGASAGGHFDDGICCASADARALTVRATALLPPTSSGMLPASSTAIPFTSNPLVLPMHVLARRELAPPLPFHARCLRRLD